MDPKHEDMRITFQAQTTTSNNDLQTGNKPLHFVKLSIFNNPQIWQKFKIHI